MTDESPTVFALEFDRYSCLQEPVKEANVVTNQQNTSLFPFGNNLPVLIFLSTLLSSIKQRMFLNGNNQY